MASTDSGAASYPEDRSSDSVARLPSLPGRPEIVERIMTEAISDPQVEMHRRRAQFTFFCGDEPDMMAGYDGQLEVVGRCLEWFVFDYIIPELGHSPAQHWFNCNISELEPQQIAEAESCLNFVLGIFEIDQVDPVNGFAARDLLRPGRLYNVSEHVINEEIYPKQMLLGRLFPQPDSDKYTLSGMAAVMPENTTSQLKQLIVKGKLKPNLILDNIDGIELENLHSRSLVNIDKIKDPDTVSDRLKRYVGEIVPGRLTFKKLCQTIQQADDPVEVAVRICRHIHIHCSHEIELIIAYIMTYWFKSHQV